MLECLLQPDDGAVFAAQRKAFGRYVLISSPGSMTMISAKAFVSPNNDKLLRNSFLASIPAIHQPVEHRLRIKLVSLVK